MTFIIVLLSEEVELGIYTLTLRPKKGAIVAKDIAAFPEDAISRV